MQHFLVSDVRDESAAAEDASAGYRVAWSINPHMTPGTTCLRTATTQHDGLVAALRANGARVDRVPFVKGCYDSVFAKDNALLLGDDRPRALVARFRHTERASEQTARARALRHRGFDVEISSAFLEGGDVVRVGGSFVVGHGFRSERGAATVVARFTGRATLAVELVDAHLYHLDTALCALDDGTVLACREAFTAASWSALERWPHVRRLVDVSRPDAMRFGLNVVQVGRTVLLARGAPAVEEALEGLGLAPVGVALDQFHRAGGSAACLVSEIHRWRPANESARPVAA